MTTRTPLRLGVLLLLLLAGAPALPARQMTQLPAGITREVVHDDAKVTVARVTFKPGARETVHTHPFDIVVVQVVPGEVEMNVGDRKSAGTSAAGQVTVIAKETPHAAANLGRSDLVVVTVAVK